MKKLYFNTTKKLTKGFLLSLALTTIVGCSESFLKPEPLSFYEPEKTFNTKAGLESALAMADRHLRTYWSYYQTEDLSLPISTEYMFSDLAIAGKTDDPAIFVDIATRVTPTAFHQRMSYFWGESYTGIKYANTVLSFIDGVEGLDEGTKNEFKGRAYFHRAFRYLALCFQFKDVPLVTKILDVPKQNYKTTKRETIIQMLVEDMKKAVEWVPSQKEMSLVGMVNKEACRHLLIKCYLAAGMWQEAIDEADILIDKSGLKLMTKEFGTFVSPLQETWNVERNVIWDLHRPENKCIEENTEVILGMPNRNGTDATIKYRSMRNWVPFWSTDKAIKTPDGKRALHNYSFKKVKEGKTIPVPEYRKEYDYNTALGRGIAHIRPTYYATHSVWYVNGVNDTKDLRHSSKHGNWARMEDLKYNDPTDTKWFGKNLRLYDDNGNILCNDTIRCWFDWPHYKVWVEDDDFTVSETSDNNRGGAGDWYCYRLAETYLLRAEAKFYKGDIPGAIADVNTIRERAECKEMYKTTLTIGDIMAERARELWMEEWRYTEMSRVSYCLALSGKTDEFGKSYKVENLEEDSYWFQRITHYHDYYNKGKATVKNRDFTMAPHNIYWPIPQKSIDSNLYGTLRQNKGYTGYDPNIEMWENWQDAVADEDKVN